MHEFHAWIGLAESAAESDLGGLAEAVGELEELAADSKWHDAVFEVRNLNGQYFLRADGMVNRRREEGDRLDLFLAVIARRLPGSWGLVYERDDEMPDPPGPNAFRVRVLARGSVVERPDPFLSPVHPVIEDLPCSLYFAPRSPMLYAITRGLVSAEAACTDQIVYLVSSTQTLRKAGLTVVASNRHAELDYAEMSDQGHGRSPRLPR
jgi:hypothetical protein